MKTPTAKTLAALRVPRWLLSLLAVLIVTNVITVAGLPSLADSYAALGVTYPSGLRIALAVVWIIVLGGLLIGLWRRKPLALFVAAPLLTLYAIVGLLMQALFARSSYSKGNLGFDTVLAVLTLLPVWWLAIRRHWLRLRVMQRAIHPPQGMD